ncbi:hypothetical protein AB0C02_28165 [Micromonospora sp. NPDC048999]|uniref:phage distal tail protein n=1 Tax=Micromonospora sp. NPDC048999 TaxID=3155391 RepID=UPI0033C1655E
MGPGTRYRIADDTNPWQSQVRADQGGARAWAHGSWSGAEWAAERVVPMRILVDAGRDDVGAALDLRHALAAAFAPVTTGPDVPLRWRQGGREYQLFVRPRMAEPDLSLLGAGRMWVRCAAVAVDPRIYSATERVTAPLGAPVYTGGLRVPFRVPFRLVTQQTAGIATAVNAGLAPAGLRLRFAGPSPQPRVTVQWPDGTRRQLRVALTLAAGEWLDVDTEARTALLNGDPTNSRRADVTGDWPLLAPGSNTLRYAAAEWASGTVTGRWWDTWW